MQIPVESWYQAIFVRRSRRSFIDKLPEEEKLERLEKICREFRPFAGVRGYLLEAVPAPKSGWKSAAPPGPGKERITRNIQWLPRRPSRVPGRRYRDIREKHLPHPLAPLLKPDNRLEVKKVDMRNIYSSDLTC